jgi:hypothetical protein
VHENKYVLKASNKAKWFRQLIKELDAYGGEYCDHVGSSPSILYPLGLCIESYNDLLQLQKVDGDSHLWNFIQRRTMPEIQSDTVSVAWKEVVSELQENTNTNLKLISQLYNWQSRVNSISDNNIGAKLAVMYLVYKSNRIFESDRVPEIIDSLLDLLSSCPVSFYSKLCAVRSMVDKQFALHASHIVDEKVDSLKNKQQKPGSLSRIFTSQFKLLMLLLMIQTTVVNADSTPSTRRIANIPHMTATTTNFIYESAMNTYRKLPSAVANGGYSTWRALNKLSEKLVYHSPDA